MAFCFPSFSFSFLPSLLLLLLSPASSCACKYIFPFPSLSLVLDGMGGSKQVLARRCRGCFDWNGRIAMGVWRRKRVRYELMTTIDTPSAEICI